MSKDRPTILQIIPRLDTGGAERATLEIAAALVRAGARALVVTDGGTLAGAITAAGGEVITMAAGSKTPWGIWANARRLAEIVAAEGVDLIHARSRAPAWSALRAARRTGRPFVTTYHGAYAERGPLKRVYNSVMARGDLVIANSQYTARLIAERYGTERGRIVTIYRGIDFTEFDPAHIAAERIAGLRAAWQVATHQPLILQAARLTSWKGQGVLIDAAARLKAQGALGNAVVVLAGSDQGRSGYAQALIAQAERLGLGERVRVVGHVSDIAAAFAAAHVAVVASVEPEAFGRAAAEAEAMGCPVIATNIGAPPETVLAAPAVSPDATTGWLVPPADADALAVAVRAALALSSGERAQMGQRARDHVHARFTLAAMQHDTLGVYDRLLGTQLAAAFATTPAATR